MHTHTHTHTHTHIYIHTHTHIRIIQLTHVHTHTHTHTHTHIYTHTHTHTHNSTHTRTRTTQTHTHTPHSDNEVSPIGAQVIRKHSGLSGFFVAFIFNRPLTHPAATLERLQELSSLVVRAQNQRGQASKADTQVPVPIKNEAAFTYVVHVAGYVNAFEHVILTLPKPGASRALALVVAEGATTIRLSMRAYDAEAAATKVSNEHLDPVTR
jgi:hypothetical protein